MFKKIKTEDPALILFLFQTFLKRVDPFLLKCRDIHTSSVSETTTKLELVLTHTPLKLSRTSN